MQESNSHMSEVATIDTSKNGIRYELATYITIMKQSERGS